MSNVPYVSEITKLPIPSCTFGLGARDIILSSQPSVFVLKTFLSNSYSWGTCKTIFSIKFNNSVTSCNNDWELVTSSLKTFCCLTLRLRDENMKKNCVSIEITKTTFLRKTDTIVASFKTEWTFFFSFNCILSKKFEDLVLLIIKKRCYVNRSVVNWKLSFRII